MMPNVHSTIPVNTGWLSQRSFVITWVSVTDNISSAIVDTARTKHHCCCCCERLKTWVVIMKNSTALLLCFLSLIVFKSSFGMPRGKLRPKVNLDIWRKDAISSAARFLYGEKPFTSFSEKLEWCFHGFDIDWSSVERHQTVLGINFDVNTWNSSNYLWLSSIPFSSPVGLACPRRSVKKKKKLSVVVYGVMEGEEVDYKKNQRGLDRLTDRTF